MTLKTVFITHYVMLYKYQRIALMRCDNRCRVDDTTTETDAAYQSTCIKKK